MEYTQRTLIRPVHFEGVGLHSGHPVRMTVKPAPVNHGIRFARVDLPNSPSVAAHFNSVVDTSLATVIGQDGFIVSTIEHLMSSLAGLSIDNAIVELNDYEVPVMDGSSREFTRGFRASGIQDQEVPRHVFVLKKTIELTDGEKSVVAHPFPDFKISCSIDFSNPVIGSQSLALTVTEDSFDRDICSARTFGFLHEIEYLKSFGLAKGGSLDNAIVVDGENIMNPDGLRFPDEFVRHKILDCIGDFSLLGMPIQAHLVIHRSGHAFHHAFLQKFFQNRECWETQSCEISTTSPRSALKSLAI